MIDSMPTVAVFLTFAFTACLFSIVLALVRRSARHGTIIAANVLRYTRNAVLTVDAHGRVTAVNEAFREVIGKKPPEILGKRYSDVFGHISALDDALREGRVLAGQEIEFGGSNGASDHFLADVIPWFDEDGRPTGAMLVLRDITVLKAREQELTEEIARLKEMAELDQVTGLYGYRYLMRVLEKAMQAAEEEQRNLALMLVGIDYFKIYNDLLGRPQGDAVLKEFAGLLVAQVRDQDVVARFGGDEFAVILSDGDGTTAVEVAERLRGCVEEHPFAGRESLPGGRLTASVGIAFYPASARTLADVIARAEKALYEAKRGARNKVELYFYGLREVGCELKGDGSEALATMRSLLLAVHTRDRSTYHHAEQVLRYSTWIGEELGLSAEEMGRLRIAAFLHDVGKIHVSPSVLKKVGPLTEEEWAEMENHPAYGADTLRPFPVFSTVLPAVLHHHERFDGGGYPYGLAGETIPLAARIIAVADGFDSMISNRPYRQALSLTRAVAELACGAGSQFDPRVAQAFLDGLNKRYRFVAVASGTQEVGKPADNMLTQGVFCVTVREAAGMRGFKRLSIVGGVDVGARMVPATRYQGGSGRLHSRGGGGLRLSRRVFWPAARSGCDGGVFKEGLVP